MTQVHVKHPKLVRVEMPESLARAAEAAAGDMSYVLRNAAELFDMIHVGRSGGWMCDTWLLALCEVAAHSFNTKVAAEGETMDRLQPFLQSAEPLPQSGDDHEREDAA